MTVRFTTGVALGLTALFGAGPAVAQQYLSGLTGAECSARGGHITQWMSSIQVQPARGDCYIPPSAGAGNGGSSGGTSGGGGGRSGEIIDLIGNSAGLIGSLIDAFGGNDDDPPAPQEDNSAQEQHDRDFAAASAQNEAGRDYLSHEQYANAITAFQAAVAGFQQLDDTENIEISGNNLRLAQDKLAQQQQQQAKQQAQAAATTLGLQLLEQHKYADAEQTLKEPAAAGDGMAELGLGVLYWNGLVGVSPDYAKAMTFFRASAERGPDNARIRAMTMIAISYLGGIGVQQDDREAAIWLGKIGSNDVCDTILKSFADGGAGQKSFAALYGLALRHPSGSDAIRKLASRYMNGDGVAADPAKAVQWYGKAADLGDKDAQVDLGRIYYLGDAVPKDFKRAAELWQKAILQGDARAANNMGVLYRDGLGVQRDYGRAATLFRTAAEKGEPNAQFGLGLLYQDGLGVARDEAEAARWILKAANQNVRNAQWTMGLAYAEGRGVPKDRAQAKAWMEKAAAAGDADAKQWLAKH